MVVHRRSSIAAMIVASWAFSFLISEEVLAQSRRHYPSDGPNQSTHTDMAVGEMVDALLTPNLPNSAPAKRFRPSRKPRFHRPSPPSALTGKLVNNPDTSDGGSEFALVDRYGGVLRYVEPLGDVDLESHLGETVTVRHDTGDILLASQLEFSGREIAEQGVQLAAYEEELIAPGGEEAGELVPTPEETLYLDAGIDFGGCPSCGVYGCRRRNGCSPGARGILYARLEYLLWWADGMYIPPLVVEGEADNGDFVNAVIVHGNQEILDGSRDGIRLRLGMWLDDCGQWAIEGDYFGFNEISSHYVNGGDGVTPPFVGRPFIDATTGLDSVQDVSFPGIQGTVTVDATSQFESAGLRLRRNICCVAGSCDCGDGVGCGCGVGVGGCGSGSGCGSGIRGGRLGTRRIDFLFGLRYSNLNESLVITEDLETIEASPPNTDILLRDRFYTENQFLGGELGFLWEWEHRRWSLELLSKLAIGNTKQKVSINGFTITDNHLAGAPAIKTNSGLLVQPTNAGDYSRNVFGVIPEIGATLGFQLTKRLRMTAGYTLVYWGNVVRPGEQIDLDVNPEFLDATLDGTEGPPFSPKFAFNETDFWTHGLNFGGELRW